MKRVEISKAVVKAKVVNVTGGPFPTLLVLVKEFSYCEIGTNKTRKVVFDDYLHKVSFSVRDAKSYISHDSYCGAVGKVGALVAGDIIEFTINKDGFQHYFSSFKVVETKQKCLNDLEGLQSLVREYVKDDEE